jgi:hypothetical protein
MAFIAFLRLSAICHQEPSVPAHLCIYNEPKHAVRTYGSDLVGRGEPARVDARSRRE